MEDVTVEIIRPGYTYRDSANPAAWIRIGHPFLSEAAAREWITATFTAEVVVRLSQGSRIIATPLTFEDTTV